MPEFVLQANKTNSNALYAHWAHTSDFPAQAIADTRFQESAQIVNDGSGRMLARPYCREAQRTTYYPGGDVGRWLLHPRDQEVPGVPTGTAGQIARLIPHPYFQDAVGVGLGEYMQQLSTLQQKTPASAWDLIPNTAYVGQMLAQSPLFVLQGAYPEGQHTAVPVLHWRKDFAQGIETSLPPRQQNTRVSCQRNIRKQWFDKFEPVHLVFAH